MRTARDNTIMTTEIRSLPAAGALLEFYLAWPTEMQATENEAAAEAKSSSATGYYIAIHDRFLAEARASDDATNGCDIGAWGTDSISMFCARN